MIDRPEIAALLNYYQADEDGVMVTVSRQAIHETAAYVDALREAAGIVECKACNMPLSWELWPIMADCPACSRARALLGQGEAPK